MKVDKYMYAARDDAQVSSNGKRGKKDSQGRSAGR